MRYQYAFINKAIYQCEYLEGGLTANDKIMKFASPLGSMMRGKALMYKECGLKQNLKGAIIYDCYKRSINQRQLDNRLELNRYEKFYVSLLNLHLYIFIKNGKRVMQKNDNRKIKNKKN